MSVVISSVYKTSDGKSFNSGIEAQSHQAHIELSVAINKSVLSSIDRGLFLGWLGDNAKLISNFLYPHNVKLEREDVQS